MEKPVDRGMARQIGASIMTIPKMERHPHFQQPELFAYAGGAIFTPLIGLISQYDHGMALAMIVPLFCYMLVALVSGDVVSSQVVRIITSHSLSQCA